MYGSHFTHLKICSRVRLCFVNKHIGLRRHLQKDRMQTKNQIKETGIGLGLYKKIRKYTLEILENAHIRLASPCRSRWCGVRVKAMFCVKNLPVVFPFFKWNAHTYIHINIKWRNMEEPKYDLKTIRLTKSKTKQSKTRNVRKLNKF